MRFYAVGKIPRFDSLRRITWDQWGAAFEADSMGDAFEWVVRAATATEDNRPCFVKIFEDWKCELPVVSESANVFRLAIFDDSSLPNAVIAREGGA